MRKLLIVVSVVSFLFGCSAIKQRNILNDLDEGRNIVDRVSIFCSAGELIGFPSAEKCTDAIKSLKGPELVAVYDAAECVRNWETKQPGYKQCIDAVNGLQSIVERVK